MGILQKLSLPPQIKRPALSEISRLVRKRWIPRRLFSNGEQGVWYDPSDLSTLFQDDAGTTPVISDGDPVGLMLDKSGNGNHASQSVSAYRPIYRTDGVFHWLEFDGVDDGLLAPNSIDGLEEHSWVGSVYIYTPSGTRTPVSWGNEFRVNGLIVRVSPEDTIRYVTNSDGKNVNFSNIYNVDRIYSTRLVGGEFTGKVDGDVIGSISAPGLIENSFESLVLGYDGREPASFHSNCRIYGFVSRNVVMTETEINTTEQYLAQKAGVTL